MSNDKSKGLSSWLKKDGKTIIQLNNSPATIAAAEKLGWKRKGSK
jgi:hypothetical protein